MAGPFLRGPSLSTYCGRQTEIRFRRGVRWPLPQSGISLNIWASSTAPPRRGTPERQTRQQVGKQAKGMQPGGCGAPRCPEANIVVGLCVWWMEDALVCPIALVVHWPLNKSKDPRSSSGSNLCCVTCEVPVCIKNLPPPAPPVSLVAGLAAWQAMLRLPSFRIHCATGAAALSSGLPSWLLHWRGQTPPLLDPPAAQVPLCGGHACPGQVGARGTLPPLPA